MLSDITGRSKHHCNRLEILPLYRQKGGKGMCNSGRRNVRSCSTFDSRRQHRPPFTRTTGSSRQTFGWVLDFGLSLDCIQLWVHPTVAGVEEESIFLLNVKIRETSILKQILSYFFVNRYLQLHTLPFLYSWFYSTGSLLVVYFLFPVRSSYELLQIEIFSNIPKPRHETNILSTNVKAGV